MLLFHPSSQSSTSVSKKCIGLLHVALANLWKCGTPISETLPIMEQIKTLTPEMKKIWEFSASAKQRDKALERVALIETSTREGLANGTYSLTDRIVPNW